MAAMNMLQFVADGGIDDVTPGFADIEMMREHARSVAQAYQEGGVRQAMKMSVAVAGSVATEGALASEDISRLMETGSVGEMAMNMDLARLARIAAAASMAGPLGYMAARALTNRLPKISAKDMRDAYLLLNNQSMRDARAQRRGRQAPTSRSRGTFSGTQAETSTPADEVHSSDSEEPAVSPQTVAQAAPSVGMQNPTQIAAELDRQKQEAKGELPNQLPSVLPSDASGIDRTGKELQRAAAAIPDQLPPINQLPGQLPTGAGQGESGKPQEAESGANDQAPEPEHDPNETAAELDRQKQTARQQLGEESSDENDEEEGEGDKIEGVLNEGVDRTDPRPGSLLYLEWEFAACIPALLVLDFEPLLYIHEHFFGYYLMPDIPFLASYLGFGKNEYDKPQSLHIFLFLLIIIIEIALLAVSFVGFLLPLIIAFAPALVGFTVLDQLLGESFFDGSTFDTLIDSITSLL